ncbi:hypothetical protein KBTX_04226 [wastewater metagenome]|uniref:Permease n=2 Tax=unclassified sequences TaxID=12908 RepID=A0A5B8RGZ5_9ZZZZ|nr:hypothetical protein KBTEX_04226 [uncultured organism]
MARSRGHGLLVDRVTLFFSVLAVSAGTAVWWTRGDAAVRAAFGHAAGLLLMVLPLVLFAVMLAAYIQQMLPMGLAERWLGAGSGVRGLLLATLAGAVTPGGPFSAFPLVVGLRGVGASLPVCVAYLTAWSVLGLQRVLVWEIPFFGAHFAAVRLLVSLPLPLIAGAAAMALTRPTRGD